eukprot:TRINITY_DN13180_c3_g1_i2.p1 TRINITY_DN13180_c3_g1~~TRINITY_DN13180_c3_g1_i2.p1  ORF type:complete len:313 (+),score=34.91 TRINITY_DN13180_c3_g1_i2:1101-2039(+)
MRAAVSAAVGCCIAGFIVGRCSAQGRRNDAQTTAEWSKSKKTYVSKRKRDETDKNSHEKPRRDVICCDALEWMEKVGTLPGSVVTGLPDITEMKELGDIGYDDWFVTTVVEIITRLPVGEVAIFHQTDARVDRPDTLSKSEMVLKGWRQAQQLHPNNNYSLLWHKISLAAPCGTIKMGRPGYTHMICISNGVTESNGNRFCNFPDVTDRGPLLWSRSMGIVAAVKSVQYIKHIAPTSSPVVDPFCGHGTVLAVASALGYNSVGVDLSPKCVKKAEKADVTSILAEYDSIIKIDRHGSWLQQKLSKFRQSYTD